MLSIVDMISDIVMITKFYAKGRQSFATASIICVSLCLGAQSIVVYGQNAKKSRGRQVQEVRSDEDQRTESWSKATAAYHPQL